MIWLNFSHNALVIYCYDAFMVLFLSFLHPVPITFTIWRQLRHSANILILCSTENSKLYQFGMKFLFFLENCPFKVYLRFLGERNGKDIERFAFYLAAPAGLNASSTSSEN